MTSTVDPNEVRVTGENSFVRLAAEEGGEFTTRASHWRVLYCPAGAGHALFLQSELTDGKVVAYTDNPAVARWLQEEIEPMLHPPFADTQAPVVEAVFSRSGDIRSSMTELVKGSGVEIALTWESVIEPIAVHAPPGTGGRTHGLYTILFPARKAGLTLNGAAASGRVVPQDREGREGSSACLAWAESWVRPRP